MNSKTFSLFSFSIICITFLSACGIDRAEADKKLVAGCKAGVELFLPEGFSIKEIKSSTFSVPDLRSDGDRRVTLNAVESDGWYSNNKAYSCNFAEDIGMFGARYSASITQVDLGDKVYGTKDGNISGSYDEWLKITNTVDAMLSR
jgi:hypothetical protein